MQLMFYALHKKYKKYHPYSLSSKDGKYQLIIELFNFLSLSAPSSIEHSCCGHTESSTEVEQVSSNPSCLWQFV